MRSAAFLVPGSLSSLTGGSIYDRRMVEGLRALGWPVKVHELDSSFPEPSAAARAGAASVLAGIADQEITVVDGLAFGAIPDVLEAHRTRLNLVALVHMPLALEFGLDAVVAARRRENELRALAHAHVIVVTGRVTTESLTSMGHRAPRPVMVEPGCDPAPLARGSGSPVVHLLCVAAVTPGKGHAGLLRALAGAGRNWTLKCAGSLTRDPATADRLTHLVKSLSLEDRVSFTGQLTFDELAGEYDRSDVFVLNTRGETFGMAVSEAIARGLPVVSTRTGAIPDLVGEEAGLLVEVEDDVALREALRTMVTDDHVRARCRAGAVIARARLRPWSDAVQQLANILVAIPGHA